MSQGPIFVVGCARSGTTLLYHMLVSAGAFVDYRAETHFYDKIRPSYGPFTSREARRRFMRDWEATETFERFGIDRREARRRVVEECRTAGEILSALFTMAAEEQGKERWADCTPLHLLSMHDIKRDIPDASFLHVIRDGRDVALSLAEVGWLRPLPWDRRAEWLVGGWVWDWQLRKARGIAPLVGDAYHEVRFEDLVTAPRDTLARISEWIDQPLDWDAIQENPVGTLSRPNSAFDSDGGEPSSREFDPVHRWKRKCTPGQVADLQATIGEMLESYGYPIEEVEEPAPLRRAMLRARRVTYQGKRELQWWLKENTVLSRHLTRPELDDL